MHKENTNNDLIQQFVSSTSPYSAILENIRYVNNICTLICCLHSDQSINNVSSYGSADIESHTLFSYVILSKMEL